MGPYSQLSCTTVAVYIPGSGRKKSPHDVRPCAGVCQTVVVCNNVYGSRRYTVIHTFYTNGFPLLYICGGLANRRQNDGNFMALTAGQLEQEKWNKTRGGTDRGLAGPPPDIAVQAELEQREQQERRFVPCGVPGKRSGKVAK